MAQHEQPAMPVSFFEEPSFLFQHAQRLDVGRHGPWHPKVWRLAYEVPVSISAEELHGSMPIREWSEIVADVSGRAAHVGTQRKVPLALLDEMAGLFEGELEPSARVAAREAARMVPMQVRASKGLREKAAQGMWPSYSPLAQGSRTREADARDLAKGVKRAAFENWRGIVDGFRTLLTGTRLKAAGASRSQRAPGSGALAPG